MSDLKKITINGAIYNVTPGSHLEDKDNPHKMTLAQIGAAPAGYGLGSSGRVGLDYNALTANGWYYMGGESCVNVPTDKWMFQYGHTFVENREGSRIFQTLKFGGVIAHRYSSDGGETWSDLEFANPPMKMGVEYRTIERYLGEAVYKKVDESGNILWRKETDTQWRLLTTASFVD